MSGISYSHHIPLDKLRIFGRGSFEASLRGLTHFGTNDCVRDDEFPRLAIAWPPLPKSEFCPACCSGSRDDSSPDYASQTNTDKR